MKEIIDQLESFVSTITGLINALSETDFNYKPAPDKWSKKEILGHLVDSAANNHQRFIRVQYEDTPSVVYDQNKWVELNNYQHLDSNQVIALWELYNRHLIWVIRQIPEPDLQRKCRVDEGRIVTLKYLIEWYVEHMEHHLKQIAAI